MEGFLADLEKANCFIINAEKLSITEQCKADEIVPEEDQIALLMDRINDYVVRDGSIKETLQTAVCCLPECIGDRDVLRGYLDEVEDMIMEDELFQDSCGLVDLFLNAIYDWLTKKELSGVIEIPNAEPIRDSDISKVILYDRKYLYMKDDLYKEIMKDALPYLPIDASKKALRDAGLLLCDCTDTYTSKARKVNVDGTRRNIRMLRLEREKMQPLGEIDFITRCLNIKEEMPYED